MTCGAGGLNWWNKEYVVMKIYLKRAGNMGCIRLRICILYEQQRVENTVLNM